MDLQPYLIRIIKALSIMVPHGAVDNAPFPRPPDKVSAQYIELIQHICELVRLVPLAHAVLFGKADTRFYRTRDGAMMNGTGQHSAHDAKRLGNEGVSSADGRQSVDGCARILRIVSGASVKSVLVGAA